MCCLLEKFIYIVFVCNSNWILNVLVRRFDGDIRKKNNRVLCKFKRIFGYLFIFW